MRDINRVQIKGRVGQSATFHHLDDKQRAVAKFTVATNEQWYDANRVRQERTTWHNIVCFRGLAIVCAQMIGKGSNVFIEGKLDVSQYTAREGHQATWVQIIAQEFTMLDPRPAVSEAPAPKPAATAALSPQQKAANTRKRNAAKHAEPVVEDVDHEVPF